MRVVLNIQRFDPENDERPRYVDYNIEAEQTDRLLDALGYVKWNLDGTFAYRRSCGHGVCGSDAMRVDGRNRLACKVLIKDLGTRVTIEPLLGFRIIKDLIVDMEPFFDLYRSIKPYLVNDTPPPEKERLQTPEERDLFDDTTKCILCGACTTACPPFWSNPNFVGPSALVNAHRFIFDSRDDGAAERLDILNHREGVWRCRTVFNCTAACPREIKVTKAIQELKRAILFGKT